MALEHLIRGIYWPQAIFGVLTVSYWRVVEHAAWVVFEDVFLIRACCLGVREMGEIADRQAELEASREGGERTVRERTAGVVQRTEALPESEAGYRPIA